MTLFAPSPEPVPDAAPTAAGVYLTVLPGPSRRRSPGVYSYRLVYRDPHPEEPGCSALWDVRGGRQRYQVALERDEHGGYHWHCTCADAVYRAEAAGRACKHVRGLCEFSPALPPPAVPYRRSA